MALLVVFVQKGKLVYLSSTASVCEHKLAYVAVANIL